MSPIPGSSRRIRRTRKLLPALFLGLTLTAAPAEQAQPPHQHDQHQGHDAHRGHGPHHGPGAQPAQKKSAPPQKKSPARKDGQKQGAAPHEGHSTEHAGHGTPGRRGAAKKQRAKAGGAPHRHGAAPASKLAQTHNGHGPSGTPGHAGHVGHAMQGFLGPYPMGREGSGTSWLPDTTPHEGIHASYGDWMLMGHALFNAVYDRQGGPRGGEKGFVGGMVMGMAQRQLGDGTLGFRAMVSPDPFMGPRGYPLLFATGETADGKHHLVDRQHPHELVMELAMTYSHRLSANSSVFVYAGLPGEPALGPPAFMHRTSSADNPEAPISHHWLDSTHTTFGVVTAGLVLDKWKIEGSVFRGREPDQHRFDIETPKLDSASARLSWNPAPELSIQVSYGHIHSPEQLAPDVNEERITASAIYTKKFWNDDLIWSSTWAWGRKMLRPGDTLDAFLFESALNYRKTYTLFARAERVEEDELFHEVPGFEGRIFTVNKVTLGGIYDFRVHEHARLGVGALVSTYGIPGEIKPFYGSGPTSFMLFARAKVP